LRSGCAPSNTRRHGDGHRATGEAEADPSAARISVGLGAPAIRIDYEFHHIDEKGAPAKVRLSELFRPGTDTLIIYTLGMFGAGPIEMLPGK
jgi:hypothetical protein